LAEDAAQPFWSSDRSLGGFWNTVDQPVADGFHHSQAFVGFVSRHTCPLPPPLSHRVRVGSLWVASPPHPENRDSSDTPRFTEETPLSPRSPYSATKAAADHLTLAYHVTHGLDVVVTRSSNNYGPNQHPEKLIPLMITRALQDRPLPIYGDGLHVRDWIHVTDHCLGLLVAAEEGMPGTVYNFGGDTERMNLGVVEEVLAILGRSRNLIRHIEDRPGHDIRYAIDFSRARSELGWEPSTKFVNGLRDTVDWYVMNQEWWKNSDSRD
jgi:dTDP-glucose 4,6-dehydratase